MKFHCWLYMGRSEGSHPPPSACPRAAFGPAALPGGSVKPLGNGLVQGAAEDGVMPSESTVEIQVVEPENAPPVYPLLAA